MFSNFDLGGMELGERGDGFEKKGAGALMEECHLVLRILV